MSDLVNGGGNEVESTKYMARHQPDHAC